MPSLKAVRRRIASVKNTQKITRAMKLVSAAKLRRAQQAAESTRSYADAIDGVIGRLVAGLAGEPHPLLGKREIKTINLLVVSSDRGLAGAYNGNVMRAALEFVREAEARGQKVLITAIGKRARDFAKLKKHRLDFITDIGGNLSYGTAELLAERVIPRWLATAPKPEETEDEGWPELPDAEPQPGDADGHKVMPEFAAAPVIPVGAEAPKAEVTPVDAVVVIYTRFKSAVTQIVVTQQILPMEAPKSDENAVDYKFEPGQREILDALLPRHVKMQLFRALLESIASEHGARMTAMDSASKNASEMIGRLTLEMNRARQAIITKELMEIVSGKEALEG